MPALMVSFLQCLRPRSRAAILFGAANNTEVCIDACGTSHDTCEARARTISGNMFYHTSDLIPEAFPPGWPALKDYSREPMSGGFVQQTQGLKFTCAADGRIPYLALLPPKSCKARALNRLRFKYMDIEPRFIKPSCKTLCCALCANRPGASNAVPALSRILNVINR